jgi:hypothetical protein
MFINCNSKSVICLSTITLGLFGLLPLQSKLNDNKEPLLLEDKELDVWID